MAIQKSTIQTKEIISCPWCEGIGFNIVPAHAYGCSGNCTNHGCPVPEWEECEYCFGFGIIETRLVSEISYWDGPSIILPFACMNYITGITKHMNPGVHSALYEKGGF